jgi:signal transduction histidine kinase
VRLGVRAGERTVIFTVDDQGPGVPAADVERIFDIYATKKEDSSQGVGLGLPLSRRLARLLGGELRAEPAVGHGGRFVLELPAGDAP